MSSENVSQLLYTVERSQLAPWIQYFLRTVAIASFGSRVETTPIVDAQVAEAVDQALSQTAIIAVAPHDSHFNTPVLQTALSRYVSRMITVAKGTYFAQMSPKIALHLFSQRWFLVNNHGAGLKHLSREVQMSKESGSNDLYVMYPQGTRDNPTTKEMNEGVAFMARQADVPIVPVLLSHSGETLMPKGSTIWPGLKAGMRRILQGQRAVETVSIGRPVDPAQVQAEHGDQSNRQLDRLIMDALRFNLRELVTQLDQDVPKFLESK